MEMRYGENEDATCVRWANAIEALSDLLPHMNDISEIHNWTIFRQGVPYI